jgi:LysM repeat protein
MRVPTNRGLTRIFGRFYVVQFGDSLFSVSQRFNVNIADILAFNEQIIDDNVIFPGEVLFIPTPLFLSREAKKKGKKKT